MDAFTHVASRPTLSFLFSLFLSPLSKSEYDLAKLTPYIHRDGLNHARVATSKTRLEHRVDKDYSQPHHPTHLGDAVARIVVSFDGSLYLSHRPILVLFPVLASLWQFTNTKMLALFGPCVPKG
ncbi:MAG: hypothetical protein BYD32DRAFT_409633 [Podila humilis]|nr:MAG: hypothetical protein BYD32DRAFT_409633 [Podila humilis]